jgi:mono/diheme cytochrome c family protein
LKNDSLTVLLGLATIGLILLPSCDGTAARPLQSPWKTGILSPMTTVAESTVILAAALPATGTETLTYAGTMQPLLNTYCGSCHGGNSPSAGVNLLSYYAVRSFVMSWGASYCMISRSLTGSGVTLMPPNQRLTSAQIQTILNWINQGALNN